MSNDGIERVITGRARDLGGFQVRRVLPAGSFQRVGPFIFFDHLGPVQMPPGHGMDVRPHPHIGLATVTYLFEGEIVHRDSLGTVQTIEPGAVNWMTAGSGIVHSERTGPELRQRGPRMHGLQSWVALPHHAEETEPAFDHYPAAALPQPRLDGGRVRVIAGTAFGGTSPVRVASPTLYCDLELDSGATLEVPADYAERALYPVAGQVTVDGTACEPGSMVVLRAGYRPLLRAEASARVMLLGGAPLEGPRYLWWNFVSSSLERLEQAKADWRAQRYAAVPGETEFIPLPEN